MCLLLFQGSGEWWWGLWYFFKHPLEDIGSVMSGMRFKIVGSGFLLWLDGPSWVSSRATGVGSPACHGPQEPSRTGQTDRGGPPAPGLGTQADMLHLLPGSLEGRGAGVPSRSTARSSLLDRAEPSFLTDPEPGSQELLGGPLEPWGSDVGCPSLALREEVDSIFPDFFPC